MWGKLDRPSEGILHMRLCLPDQADKFEYAVRSRDLYAQQQNYQWVHTPGQPPYCKGVPPGEEFTKRKERLMGFDVVESLADMALAAVIRVFSHNDTVDSFRRYYPIRHVPNVAQRWREDEEFARQRLDGINPILIALAREIPENFPVTNDTIRGLVPDHYSLEQLLSEQRLFLLDYKILQGLQPTFGRFCVAPICLFWVDDTGRLMPLAIQLGQSPAEAKVIFTPKDHYWTWLLARTYVQSADGSYHEVVAHLTRTHLAMETFWVAAARTLPPQHPLHQLLEPHFTGTIEINNDARTKLIVPGGPIDESIAIGSEGSLTLIGLEYADWKFDVHEPMSQLRARGVDSPEIMPNYHYRDDSLLYFTAIEKYVHGILEFYYRSDEDILGDVELQAWMHELSSKEGGRVKGLPLKRGKVTTLEDLCAIVTQIIFSCSVEHAAVNNGQYAQFGWIPNTPGAMYLPPPQNHDERDEANFVYALPDAYAVGQQLTLVHLLSQKTLTPLGLYDATFFDAEMPVRMAIDRFRADLDDIGRHIQERNRHLEVPYKYLEPWVVGRSIAI